MKGKRKVSKRNHTGSRPGKRRKNCQQQPVEVWDAWSVWQEPEHPVLETVFEHLLAHPGGKRWVRVASHVCSFWRAAAQDVLLADTAVSKPERPPMPQVGSDACTKPSSTVQTQAAVVLEASNSTGYEALSKELLDNPPPKNPLAQGAPQLVLWGGQLPSGGQLGRQQAQQGSRPSRHGRARPPPAAHHPSQPAIGAPQGSIQSGMAMQHTPLSDSESDGSTGAQPHPAARQIIAAARPATRSSLRHRFGEQVSPGGGEHQGVDLAGGGRGQAPLTAQGGDSVAVAPASRGVPAAGAAQERAAAQGRRPSRHPQDELAQQQGQRRAGRGRQLTGARRRGQATLEHGEGEWGAGPFLHGPRGKRSRHATPAGGGASPQAQQQPSQVAGVQGGGSGGESESDAEMPARRRPAPPHPAATPEPPAHMGGLAGMLSRLLRPFFPEKPR